MYPIQMIRDDRIRAVLVILTEGVSNKLHLLKCANIVITKVLSFLFSHGIQIIPKVKLDVSDLELHDQLEETWETV